MARDHTRVNIDIWGDDEFRDLPVDAQNLYWFLWTSPDRSYCGGHWWHPTKLTQFAADWTVGRVVNAGAVLSQRLFLVIDEPIEECLLRSWIKHDGLWKQPNMAVSMANARGSMASKICRGVIVHEVKKLAAANPELGGWKRKEVANLLSQRAIDAATIDPYTPPPTPGLTPASTPALTPTPTPDLRVNAGVGVNPPLDPAPTTATATSSNSSKQVETLESARSRTGTRLPDGWQPDQNVVAQMRSDHPHVDLRTEHAKFSDYWRSKPGKDGRKSDWNATWRNWIRRAAEQRPGRTNSTRPTSTADDRVASVQALKRNGSEPS